MNRPYEAEVLFKASHKSAERFLSLTGLQADVFSVLAQQVNLAVASSVPFKNTFHIMNTLAAYTEELSDEIKKGADADLAQVTHAVLELAADLVRWVVQVGWKAPHEAEK